VLEELTCSITWQIVFNVERISRRRCSPASTFSAGSKAGWEFGPRALGGPSIIGDPPDRRRPGTGVNASVKFREEWRPFAPACLVDRAHEFFEPANSSPFMILTFTVKQNKRKIIPAVTPHRPQCESPDCTEHANPRYWGLI